MRKTAKYCVLILTTLPFLSGCSSDNKSTSATKSANKMVRFVETGDTTLLQGVFTDSLLNLMSIGEMVATREDFTSRFGSLQIVEGPEFPTDSTANLLLRYERMSLLASLEFNNQGKIRFLATQPEPVKRSDDVTTPTNVKDVHDVASFAATFDADSDYVRLVTILSPT